MPSTFPEKWPKWESISLVGDNEERLANVLQAALGRSELIIMTGGLGPTKDDLTKEVAASFFGKELIFDQKTYEHVRSRLESYGITKMTESQKKQALIPEGSLAVQNQPEPDGVPAQKHLTGCRRVHLHTAVHAL